MRLTKRMLDAIIYAVSLVEAEGHDGCQGVEPESERERVFEDIMKAGGWAAQQLRKRQQAKGAKP